MKASNDPGQIVPDSQANLQPQPPHQPLTIGIVRFALELAAIVGLGWWGWALGDGGFAGTIFAILIPGIAFTIWGVFAVRNDPSRNPNPPVAVPGWLRLIIELSVFGLAAYGIWTSGSRAASETLLTGVGIVYAVTWDRQWWLLKQR
ncbi:MAG: YrdB family protein [Thermomicrobiales bacterium]